MEFHIRTLLIKYGRLLYGDAGVRRVAIERPFRSGSAASLSSLATSCCSVAMNTLPLRAIIAYSSSHSNPDGKIW
ncbi:hypothetical protein LEP1GSC050_3219 [Leptospira broomii serovar Hurstbridge str. 5399]|uniref:Uncharacterized protein n=1 Tax=Leptospira broomii serovar Hurstbridge str. 5399 TaxID=1049789 RepID=T0F9R2_9LEPT|nr:hypothetical protein [Leptospira broomii]EQA44621.1 hypothetical protein LEP1GSC050_3219 [Leptospira broomii serovar Hurstbridge str. 5399]